MSSFVDSLNLRPQEKRLIVGIAVVAFVVLNYLFVLPHFKDYANMKNELKLTLGTNLNFSAEIGMDNNPTNGYKWKLAQLRKGGSDASEVKFSGAIQLQTTVAQFAQKAGVNVSEYDPVNLVHLGTNAASQFFDSQSIRITVKAKEDNLVDFLYNVGNDPAMIRVRELDLHPADANRYELTGQITLTADYKKSDKAATAKLMADKSPVAPPTAVKIPGINTPKTNGPAALPVMPPAGRGPAATPPNGRGAAAPALRGANGRGPNVPASPPPFPTIPPRRPAPATPPAVPGNNQ